MIANLPADTESIGACVLCGANGARDPRFERFLALEQPYGVRRCGACGFRWLSPRPTAAAYEHIYGYETYFDGDAAVERYSALAVERLPYFCQRIEYLESLFQPETRLRILDVGAATGEFVHAAISRGHDAVGLEISAGAIQQAARTYGIRLDDSLLHNHTPGTAYDVVHMNHVLEHMPDPTHAARDVSRLLRPGGIWAAEVPQQFENDLDRLRRLAGISRPKFNLYSLHHTCFFRPQHLSRLVQQAGFEPVMLRTANAWRTPLRPFTWKNLVLRMLLGAADAVHAGGNIIEMYARKR